MEKSLPMDVACPAVESVATAELCFSAMFREHSPFVFAMLRTFVPRDVAEEITQEVFAVVWRGDRYDESRGSRRGYLYGIARNKAIDWLRRNNALTARDRRFSALRKSEVLTDDAVCDALEGRRMLDALSMLPAAQREAIELAYFGGLSYREVAVAMELPVGTVKSRIRGGLRQMQRLLATPLDLRSQASGHQTGVQIENRVHAHGAPVRNA